MRAKLALLALLTVSQLASSKSYPDSKAAEEVPEVGLAKDDAKAANEAESLKSTTENGKGGTEADETSDGKAEQEQEDVDQTHDNAKVKDKEDAKVSRHKVNMTKVDPLPLLPVKRVTWTEEKDMKLPNGKKHRVAFRDLVVEKTGQRIFESFMERVRKAKHVYGYHLLRDPMPLREGMRLSKKSSLVDIDLSADNMKIHGFHDLKMTYIRVIRHYGLRDIKVNLRLGSDIRIEGRYELQGRALSFLPVTGSGDFSIDLRGCTLSAITFLVLNTDGEEKGEDSLVIRELEVTVDHDDVSFDFQNLMGGGVVGSAANKVINTIGEAIVDSQRQQIIRLMKSTFKQQVSAFI